METAPTNLCRECHLETDGGDPISRRPADLCALCYFGDKAGLDCTPGECAYPGCVNNPRQPPAAKTPPPMSEREALERILTRIREVRTASSRLGSTEAVALGLAEVEALAKSGLGREGLEGEIDDLQRLFRAALARLNG